MTYIRAHVTSYGKWVNQNERQYKMYERFFRPTFFFFSSKR